MGLWKSWYELNSLAKHRKHIYLYGRSEDWVHKCLKNLKATPLGIADREESYHGKKYYDLPIQPIENIELTDDILFIITAGDYEGIVDTLESKGMKPGHNFVCSPDFKDYSRIVTFHQKNYKILLSCSDYNDQSRARASRSGGGLYELNTRSGNLTKILTGSFRQFEYYRDWIAAVDYVSRKLVFLDNNNSVAKNIDLPKPNYCGLAIDDRAGIIYIANAGDDSILVVEDIDSTKPKLRELKVLNNGIGNNREAHINDLYLFDSKLFFSYFSRSGNYKVNSFDGGVSHYDLYNNELSTEIISKLWKPHSPKIIDGKLWILDSMRGRLVSGFGDESYDIGGFVRGLDHMEEIFVIGQSQDMYLSDRISQRSAVSVDSGVYLFDIESKALRFMPINSIMNIHDLKVLENV